MVRGVLFNEETGDFVDAGDYDYSNGPNGPTNWGNLPGAGVCTTGRMQSPMVITRDNTVGSNSLDKTLNTTVPQQPIPATIINTNKTIEVNNRN